jgi:hypothetical protein
MIYRYHYCNYSLIVLVRKPRMHARRLTSFNFCTKSVPAAGTASVNSCFSRSTPVKSQVGLLATRRHRAYFLLPCCWSFLDASQPGDFLTLASMHAGDNKPIDRSIETKSRPLCYSLRWHLISSSPNQIPFVALVYVHIYREALNPLNNFWINAKLFCLSLVNNSMLPNIPKSFYNIIDLLSVLPYGSRTL